MSLIDSIMKTIAGSPGDIANLANSLGIDPKMAETAILALAKAHPMQGDTVELASASTGVNSAVLGQIVSAIGGEGSLGNFATMLDADGDGNPLGDLAGMAGKLFGQK
ncbi:hypothetical protein NUH86_22480 (plasmid) [Sphingobium sp. JS3065]|uniref:hypothetical protein n=1 Tax=Sphingobium sp. JS3065 TaxID=2970925 RepID=UPI0022652457|nr:hypothetical protein [Sphingobium sp. JS3065]UZW58045.1 hypothetical protein NUH86_22480 [Sphingobium sp. JS3065]